MRKIKTIKIETEEKVIDKAFCDFCGGEFDECNVSSNGFGTVGFHFGYGSGFDDDSFYLDICDDCFRKEFSDKLKDQMIEKGFDIKKVMKSTKNNLKEKKKK